MSDIIDDDYREFLSDLKRRVVQAQTTAARVVNRELILLYWDIAAAIVEKQKVAKWGDAVVERLSSDLRYSFPDVRGFSADNVWRRKQLFETWSSPEFLEQAVPEIENAGRNFLEQPVPDTPKPNPPDEGFLHSTPQIQADQTQAMQVIRRLVATIPWGHHLEIMKKA